MTSAVAFTVADLALCDSRRASHFAAVLGDAWADQLAPLPETLDADARTTARAPFVHAVDEGGRLRRVVVDQRLVAATRRAADAWRRLRELDGLKQDRAMTPPPAQAAATNGHAAAEAPAPPASAEAPAAPAAGEARDPDEAYIETARCSTCNECTQLNPRMFAYNENKQAYIKDITAGTYRELVEAAEICQVAIIHPGKPRDPKEPGLEELLQRAETFR
jgi:ferredoxin